MYDYFFFLLMQTCIIRIKISNKMTTVIFITLDSLNLTIYELLFWCLSDDFTYCIFSILYPIPQTTFKYLGSFGFISIFSLILLI